MSLNLFEVLPDTFIQESLATRAQYQNLASLYELDNEVRLSLLDLLRLNKLKLFHGIVYSFGWNEYGQLGTGNINDEEIPTQISFSAITDMNGRRKRVIRIEGGDEHSLVLCGDGTVYSFGNGRHGQLGYNNLRNIDIRTPLPIDVSNIGDKRVIQVAPGRFYSLILCEDGSVYSFGSNVLGQLGNGNTNRITIPTSIDPSNMEDRKVIQVAAGDFHSLILCEDGTVYSFGSGEDGQLGIGNTDYIETPTQINIGSKNVIQVSAGGNYSLILCEDGTVYSFGYNEYGQLGTGNRINISIPTEIATSNIGSKRVIQVAAGNDHSLILCEDGTVFSFGFGAYGQLGNGSTDSVAVPIPINTSNMEERKVIQVSTGNYYSLFLCDDGTVYSCGYNYFGQLGIGNTDDVAIPTPIDTSYMDGKRVIQVSAGGRHSLILT